jgi:predicted phosphodiesterase
MRYGVLSDIHANLPALDAALGALSAQHVERYVCTGDIVGYGPHPNECVERLRELDSVAVVGNHDLMAVGALSLAGTTSLVAETIAWTRAALAEPSREYLRGLPLSVELADGVVMAHGSLEDPRVYVRSQEDMGAELVRMQSEYPGARVLLLGHLHHQVAYQLGRGVVPGTRVRLAAEAPWLLNAGAVGQARERQPMARFMVLDTDGEQARFLATRYDEQVVSAALAERGLPSNAHHPRTSWIRRRARVLAKLRDSVRS